MSYKAKMFIHNLDFDGTELDGLHVKVRSVTVAQYNKLVGNLSDDNISAKDNNDWIIGLFFKRLIEWDLQDEEGKPIEKSLEGIADIDSTIINSIIQAWQRSLVQVPTKQSSGSSNGRLSAEESLELGRSSVNLPS